MIQQYICIFFIILANKVACLLVANDRLWHCRNCRPKDRDVLLTKSGAQCYQQHAVTLITLEWEHLQCDENWKKPLQSQQSKGKEMDHYTM